MATTIYGCPIINDNLKTRRARIRSIAEEIERFPTERLVERLCAEADVGIRLDQRCAVGFTRVRNAALDLMREGDWPARSQLPAAVEVLDDMVTVRLMQHSRRKTMGIKP